MKEPKLDQAAIGNEKVGYAVWPEGQPEKARYASNRIKMEWLMFSMGFRTWWPDPRKAKRMSNYWPVVWVEDPVKVAEMCEKAKDLHTKHFGPIR